MIFRSILNICLGFLLDSVLVFLLLVVLMGRFCFKKHRPHRILPRMLAKGNRKDVTRARERDASLNRRGRNSPEATWIRPRLSEPHEAVCKV